MASDSVMDERTLREIYLTGFEIAIKEGHAKSIMSSYNRINGVYIKLTGHPSWRPVNPSWRNVTKSLFRKTLRQL